MRKIKKMPFKDLWERELAGDIGASAARDLITEFQNKYNELCANHREISNRVLKKHLHGNIFPQMAAYKTFIETNTLSEAALSRTQKLHFLTLQKQKKHYESKSKLPYAFTYFRIFIPIMIKLYHPPAGWNIEWLENSKKCISMKVHTCFYNEIMKEYGIPELILIYCNGDDYVFDEVKSPYIEWGRKETLTRGGDYCDVIYYKKFKK